MAASFAYLGLSEDVRRRAQDLVVGLQGKWAGLPHATLGDYVEYVCRVIPFRKAEDGEHLLDDLYGAVQAV